MSRKIVFCLLIISLCVSVGFVIYNTIEAIGYSTMASELKLGMEESTAYDYLEEKVSELEEQLEELQNRKLNG